MEILLTRQQFEETYKLNKFAKRAIDKYKLKFPIYSTANLAKIVAYLTFDGHMTVEKGMIIFTAGKKELLKEPMQLMYKQFGVKGKIKKVMTNNYGKSFEYRISNKPLCRILKAIGVPDGNKIFNIVNVPKWIKNSKKFSKVYLRVAFDCEGSIWKEKNGAVRLRFRLHKSSKKIKNCISFINEIKNMLSYFNIETTNIWFGKGNLRKDGNITKAVVFGIKSNSMQKFKKAIGFGIKEKKYRLSKYVK
jgi:DNA-binding transcriptional regulator WhiA